MLEPLTIRDSLPDYDDAVLPFRAQFYEVKPPLWSYINRANSSDSDM